MNRTSKSRLVLLVLGVGVWWLGTGIAQAQVTVFLPDTSQATTFTANVSEQARVVVPASVTFNVTDVAVATPATAAAITIDRIVLASATKQFRISLQAGASAFTPPVGGATTWSASDISWNAPTWTNATGSAGTLSSSAYTTLSTCIADAAACSTTGLVFTLAGKTTVNRSGSHTLSVTWKFESF